MKVRLVNYKKLAFGFIKKSQIADNQYLYRLSSNYFSLAQKIYRIANTELQEKIDKNKNVIKESNRTQLSNFIEDDPNKEQIYAFFESLEFPYEVNFGDTSQEYNKTKTINILYIALELMNKNVNADVALALADRSGHIGGRSIEEKANLLLEKLETKNQKYGFIDNRRMNFRTPTLLIDIYLNLDQLTIPLETSRADYLNLMYSEGENFSFDKEHFDSALNLNYILGKQAIPFVQKCQTESSGNPIVDIPHIVDNTINLSEIEYDPKITEFIVKNYFNINLRRDIENKLRSELNLSEEEIKKYTNDILSSDSAVAVSYTYFRKSDFLRDAKTKLRTNLSSVISNWARPIRIQGEEFKSVSELSNMPIEKLCNTITNDIAAEDIGYENITNERLFQAMLKYQKNDIKSFLRIQKLVDQRPEESEWYTDLTKSRVENNSYIAKVLPKNDSRFPFVGAISGCCQKINGAGVEAFLNTFGSNSGIFVITDKKDNIVAQSYIWINDTTISLDSIESQYKSFNHQDFKDIYEKACNEIFSKYFDVVLCGSNNTNSVFTDAERLVPLEIFKNNDQNYYTYDTAKGRSILFAKPEAANKYPILSVFEKVKNNLNEPLNDDEIKILLNDQTIKNNVCNSFVKKYINELEDVINKENLLKLYNQLGRPTFPEDFDILCLFMERPELVSFDINLNKTQFQISLNKWLRDGNLLNVSNEDSDKQKIKEEIAKIDSFNYPTKLYKVQKLISPNFEMPQSQIKDFFYEMKDEDKKYLLSKIPQNMPLKQFLGEKIDLESLQFIEIANDFFSDLLNTYIQNNQFSNDDIKFVNDNMFKRSWDKEEIPRLINSGFIDYFFKPLDDGGFLLPNFDIVKSIADYVKNISKNQNFEQYDEKLKPIIKEIVNNSDSYPINSGAAFTLGHLVNNCLQYNFADLNINNRNTQKLLAQHYLQDKIPQEINNLYLSNYNFIARVTDKLNFAQTLNLIVDYPYIYNLDKLKNVDTIQHINAKAQYPLILSSSIIRSLSEASDSEITYDKKDLLKMLDQELNSDTMKRSLYSAVDTKENSFRTNIKQRILEMLRYSLSDIPNQINNMLPEINQLMDMKINQLINDLRNDTSNTINQYYVDKFLEHEKIQTPPAQPEEQNEITASNKRRLKYSIKIK
jgi:hypothetical protein